MLDYIINRSTSLGAYIVHLTTFLLVIFSLFSCDSAAMNAFLDGYISGTRAYHHVTSYALYSWNNFYLLEGTIIIAEDGQPIGVITVNRFNSDSLVNEFGPYGNKFNSKSIFNRFGPYGNKFSSLSPFNEFSSTPPKIYDRMGNVVAYFTTNKLKTPRVDPVLLIAWLKANE